MTIIDPPVDQTLMIKYFQSLSPMSPPPSPQDLCGNPSVTAEHHIHSSDSDLADDRRNDLPPYDPSPKTR